MRIYERSELLSDKAAIEHLSTIKRELTRRNMTIAELSRQIKLSKSLVYQWANGTCYPIPDNYNKLADFFGWPHFLGGE